MLACHEEYCSAGVPKIMEPYGWWICSFQEGLEVAAEEVGAALGGVREGWEDEIVVLPEGTGGEPFPGYGATGGAPGLLWPFGSTL